MVRQPRVSEVVYVLNWQALKRTQELVRP